MLKGWVKYGNLIIPHSGDICQSVSAHLCSAWDPLCLLTIILCVIEKWTYTHQTTVTNSDLGCDDSGNLKSCCGCHMFACMLKEAILLWMVFPWSGLVQSGCYVGLIDWTICSVKAQFWFSPVKNPVIAQKGNRLIWNLQLRLIHHRHDSTSTVGTSGNPSLCLTSCLISLSHFWSISWMLIPHSFKLHISQSPLTTQSYRTSSVGDTLPLFLTSLSFSTPSLPTLAPVICLGFN